MRPSPEHCTVTRRLVSLVRLEPLAEHEIGFMVNKKGDHSWTKHYATSELGGTTKHFTVISWIPHPMDSQKREYFVLRTG